MQKALLWCVVAAATLMVIFVTAGFARAEMDDDDVLIAQYINAASAVGTLMICAQRVPRLEEEAREGFDRLKATLLPHVNNPNTVLGRAARYSWAALQITGAKLQYLHFDSETKTYEVLAIRFPTTCVLASQQLKKYQEPGGILQFKGGLDAMKLENIDELEQMFLTQSVAYSDLPSLPVHARWGMVLTELPEMGKRRLYSDLTDLFQRIYARGTYQQVGAAHDVAILRGRFYVTLKARGSVLPHVFTYEYENSLYWQRKLFERWQEMKPARRVRNRFSVRIIPEKVNPVSHRWVH